MLKENTADSYQVLMPKVTPHTLAVTLIYEI